MYKLTEHEIEYIYGGCSYPFEPGCQPRPVLPSPTLPPDMQ